MLPSRTPYPTKTQVSTIAENMLVIEKEVIKEVEVIVTREVVITATPNATPIPLPVQQVINREKNKMRIENALVGLLEILTSKMMLYMYALIVLAWIAKRIPGAWVDAYERRLEHASGETEAPLQTKDERDYEGLRVRLSIRKAWAAGMNMNEAERLTWPDSNSWGGPNWNTVKGMYEEWNDKYGGQPTPPPRRDAALS